jgi:hydroxymethylglutaryl-CoA reductase
MRIEVFPNVPRAMGLGGSAALAVAVIRAIDAHYALGLSDERINELAFECEKVAHGTPSGIDNTLATWGQFMLFRNGETPEREVIEVSEPLSMVVGMSGVESLTARTVARVREAWKKNPVLYERIFDEIDTLAGNGLEALRAGDYDTLGELMNVCQGLLNAMQVSSWELEELVEVARKNGAAGAKLTGGGGGGSIIALCPEDGARVARAIRAAGYNALEVQIGGC